MLTNKEIKLLNLIHFKLKGEHIKTIELWQFLQEFFRLKKDLAFELAYLYDNNFEEANGDFSNVKNVIRLSYEEYEKSLAPEIKGVMEITKDSNLKNYDLRDEGIRKVVNHSEDGLHNTEYIVFKNKQDLNEYATIIVEEYMEDDPDSYVNELIDHTYIIHPKKNSIALEETEKILKKYTIEDIITHSGMIEEYDDLGKTKDKLNKLLGHLINAISLMDDYLKLHRLGKEEEDQDEYIRLKHQINQYKEYINAIHDKVIGGSVIKDDMTIDEITNEVDEILYEIDYQIDELIVKAENEVRESIGYTIYERLTENPFEYFNQNFDMDIQDYLGLDFVNINYEMAADDYINSGRWSYSDILGYVNEKKIRITNGQMFIIFW